MTPPLEGMVPWPADITERYRARGYWTGETLGSAFDRSVAAHADRVAVVEGERRLTYRQLGGLVDRLARHLVEREIVGGARVVFQLPNVLEFVVAYFACLKVGAIPLACLPAHRHAEIGYLARFTEASAWFLPSTFRGFDYVAMAEELRAGLPSLREIWVAGDRVGSGMTRFADLLADPGATRAAATTRAVTTARAHPQPSDVAVFQLSGGTTGLPKVIPRTHDDYLYNSRVFAAITGVDRETVLLVTVPISHNFPLACPGIQGTLLAGGRVVLGPSPDAETVFSLVERERVTWLPAVPASVIGWLNDPRITRTDLTSVRTLAVGGSRLNPEPARRVLSEMGPVLMQVFGMAEGLLCSTRAELQCRGPYTIRGYYRAPEHNRAAFTDDGFYRTGDMVRMHPSGNIVVEGRKKDLINRGGEKISAEEVENLILSHPAVLNVAVVAVPDEVLGERACACVMLRPGTTLTLADLTDFLLREKRIAKFKLPERLQVRDRFPTTAVGKISKKDLREEVRGLS